MRFLLFFTLLIGGLTGFQYYILRRLRRIFQFTSSYKIFFAFVLLPASFMAVNMLSRRFWNIGMQLWYLATMSYIGAIWIVFWLLLVYQLLQWLIPMPPRVSRYVVVIGAGLLLGYSIFQSYHLTVKTVEIFSTKITQEIRIVQLSDLHLGLLNGTRFVDRVIAQTKQLQPDMVVVTGDVFDRTEEAAEILRGFNDLTVPAFLVFGNHDHYAEIDKVRDAISQTPLKIVENSSVIYKQTVQVAGIPPVGNSMNDRIAPVLRQLPLRDGYFTILLSHIPIDFRYTAPYPIDLTLSGHTHSGQLFPIFVIFKRFYPYLRGLYHSGTQYLYVSSGTSTWGPPMRLGTWSEVTLIRLRPQKNVAQK